MQSQRLSELAARAAFPVRVAALATAAWSAFACFYVMFGRLLYPYELEWMSGTILDHVERVQHGLPLYTAPTASWIPFVYPPLYYWVCAAVSHVLPLVVACRAVSIVGVLVQAACIWSLARSRGASRFWAALGLGAFFAAYAIVDFWYDLERPDMLFMALVLLAAVVLERTKGLAGALLSGLLVGLAFCAKQPAAVFLLGGAAALVVRREWARAVAFALAGAAVIVALVVKLQGETGGWFGYYVLAMPRAHGMSWSLVPMFVFADLPRAWAWTLSTVAIVAVFLARWRNAKDDAVFVAFLAASFVASASSRLHIGGWSNVLCFWTAFGAAGIAVLGARLDAFLQAGRSLMRAAALLVPATVAVQLLACAYAPADFIPIRASVGRFTKLVDEVRSLEKDGEVIAVGRGHLTAHRHFHMAALIDVITVEHHVPEDVMRAFRERRFSAVLIDDFADLWIPLHPEIKGELFRVVAAGYYVARRVDDRVPRPIVGWLARPTWVLLPRKERLPEDDRDLLERRTRIELELAQVREEAERRGTTLPASPEATEVIAKDAVERAFAGAKEPEGDAGEP